MASDPVTPDVLDSIQAALGGKQNVALATIREEIADATVLNIDNLSITTAMLGADCVDGTKIGDDVIESEHYAAGSIDNEHLAANSVDSSQIAAGAVDDSHLAGSIGATKMAIPVVGAQSAALTKADAGTVTLLSADATNDRIVFGTIKVSVAIADGDGSQPTFSVGETDTVEKFVATSELTDGAAALSIAFCGTLSATKALIVTVGAGSGSTQAGTVQVQAAVTSVSA